jgi:hypothetical protein
MLESRSPWKTLDVSHPDVFLLAKRAGSLHFVRTMKTPLSLFNHSQKVCGIDEIAWLDSAVPGARVGCLLHTPKKVFLGLDDDFSIECADGVRRKAEITNSSVAVSGWVAAAKVLL